MLIAIRERMHLYPKGQKFKGQPTYFLLIVSKSSNKPMSYPNEPSDFG